MTIFRKCAAVAALLVALPVSAAETVPSIALSYADLDLRLPAARQILNRRINAAADAVCGSRYEHDLVTNMAIRHCIEQARASARPQVELAVARASNATRVATAH